VIDAMAVCQVTVAQVGSHVATRHGSGFVRIVPQPVVGSLVAETARDRLRAVP